jgi:hypothetical protein
VLRPCGSSSTGDECGSHPQSGPGSSNTDCEQLPGALGRVQLVPELKEPAAQVAWSTVDVDGSGGWQWGVGKA